MWCDARSTEWSPGEGKERRQDEQSLRGRVQMSGAAVGDGAKHIFNLGKALFSQGPFPPLHPTPNPGQPSATMRAMKAESFPG